MLDLVAVGGGAGTGAGEDGNDDVGLDLQEPLAGGSGLIWNTRISIILPVEIIPCVGRCQEDRGYTRMEEGDNLPAVAIMVSSMSCSFWLLCGSQPFQMLAFQTTCTM